MSHFSVLVITKSRPTDDRLKEILQPWHEFECTGEDDKYVVDVDKTDEYRKSYEKETSKKLRDSFGHLHCPYDDRFYRDPTPEEEEKAKPMLGSGCTAEGVSFTSKDWGDGKGYRPKVRYVPNGFTEVEVADKDVITFREYCAEQTSVEKEVVLGKGGSLKLTKTHQYGYTVIDKSGEVVRVVDRTNPNSKWDWWQVGGRYGGKLRSKSGQGRAGDPGVFGKNREQEDGGLDQVRVGDLDVHLMKEKVRERRRESYRSTVEKLKMESHEVLRLWSAFATNVDAMTKRWEDSGREKNRWDFFREHGDEQFVESIEVAGEFCGLFGGLGIPEHQPNVLNWVENPPAVTCFAFVTADGEWVGSGDMGWFGMTSNDVDGILWEDKVSKMVESLPPDYWITVVDCHI